MSLTLAVYALLTSALLALGATVATRLAGSAVRRLRFAWAIAMTTAIALVFLAPLRDRAAAVASTKAHGIDAGALARLVDGLDAPLNSISQASGGMPSWLAPLVAALWALSSIVFIASFLASYRRHRRRVNRSSRATIAGVDVRVVDGLGPAVIGVSHADIVVPAWLLLRPEAEQRLIVRHELSHVAVGDPMLLLAGCAGLAAMPWNPAMWYMLGRLRLAIELDCDRRVLADGVPAHAYGAALIELTALLPRRMRGIGVPAFSYRPSHLERRLAAMTAKPMSYRRARLAAASAVGALALIAACDSQLPTSTEIEAMDVEQAVVQASPLLGLGSAETQYLIDGVVVTREVAVALPASKIASIAVSRSAAELPGGGEVESTVPSIYILTTDSTFTELRRMEPRAPSQAKRPFTLADSSIYAVVLRDESSSKQKFEGLLVIDGVLVESSRLESITPASIASVEVVKGAAARLVYGERGAKGVIMITTKATP